MNELAKIFNYENQKVRMLKRNGKPWFVARDICGPLGLKNVTRAVSTLDDDERGIAPVNTLGDVQQLSVVSESGLYSLIFKSRKKEARAFQKWVMRDALPSIRKTEMGRSGLWCWITTMPG